MSSEKFLDFVVDGSRMSVIFFMSRNSPSASDEIF